MSLRMLFDDDAFVDFMTAWPTEPAVHELPAGSRFPVIVTAELLHQYLETGAAPADEIDVVNDGAACHPGAYTTAGHLDPAKLARCRARGYSVRLRNLNRWYPPLHGMCSAIQRETGFGCSVTGFVTPPGARSVDYHWDQHMGIMCQLAGRKRWQIWEPVVTEPHRNYLPSDTRLVERLVAAGPDRESEIGPGRVLVLPRGWVHRPHACDQSEESVHLAFALRERTGHWIGEKLASAAIESASLRRVIAPVQLADAAAFAEEIDRARAALIDWLVRVDDVTLAAELLASARNEPDPDYV